MKRNSVKYIIYFLEAVFGFALQGTPYLMPELFGEKAVILLPLAITVSFFEDESISVPGDYKYTVQLYFFSQK